MSNEIFDIDLYNDDFFAWHLKYARDYSIKTMDWYIDIFKPASVIDFGCGIASYLESAWHKGITKLKGYDIAANMAAKYIPEQVKPSVERVDCTFPIKTKKYDCVISFETAEHIEPIRTNTFIQNIVNAVSKTGFILFTAAPPDQDGTGHINCHDKDQWIIWFVATGKVEFLAATTQNVSNHWRELGAPEYICNNLMIFKPKK